MANINNKLFAYSYAKINDADLLKQYENSLIFLGYEGQIYQPLTNTYIGIGKTAYNNLVNQINDVTGNKISEVVDYLNKTNTGKIYAQYSDPEFNNLYPGGGSGNIGSFNTDIYDANNIYTTSNEIVLRGANQFTGIPVADMGGLQNVFANSGINVSIKRGAQHVIDVNPVTGEENVAYFETSYITIDDSYTWSYIGNVNAYITNYAQKIAVDQANRVYKNLLGINDDVHIEKGFNEAFTFNTLTNELVTMDGGQVFVKVKGPNYGDSAGQSLTDFTFEPVTIDNSLGQMTIGEGNNKLVIFKRDTTTGQWKPWTEGEQGCPDFTNTFSFVEGDGSMAYYNWDGDGDDYKEYVPIFYQKDSSYTAYTNINIADGINTIKEVAYILDLITDGTADDGINLTYNIVQNGKDITYLLNWKEEIGDHSVTSITAEDNDSNLITLTQYSVDHKGEGETTGDVVIETKLNVAPVIPNRSYIKGYDTNDDPIYGNRDYAVYDPDLLTDAEQFLYTYQWIYNPNYSTSTGNFTSTAESGPTYVGGWFTYAGWQANKSNYLVENNRFIADGSNNVWVIESITGTPPTTPAEIDFGSVTVSPTTVALVENLTGFSLIYIPWSLPSQSSPEKDGVLDALTDVRWVTSYVNAAYEDLKGQIRDTGGGATEMIEEEFLKRTVSYAAPAGKYFTGISQDNGILSTYTVANLPTDFLSSDSTVTSYNIKYVKVTGAEISNTAEFSNKIIYDENFAPVIGDYTADDTIYYVKLADGTNGFTQLGTSYQITDINKSIYILDGNVYKPISIQDAIADGGISSNFATIANSYFYASETAANDKYLEANSIHIEYEGSNKFRVNANITYVRNATDTNTGFADAYDVRKTIEDMFTWIDLSTNAPYGMAASNG